MARSTTHSGRRTNEGQSEGARNALDTYITGIVKDAREQAWREGYYAGKRDYAVSITGGVLTSTPNPYATHENEGSRNA